MRCEAFILTLFSLTVTFATESHAAMDRLKEASDMNSFAKCNPFNVQAKGITSCEEYFETSSVNLEACDLNLGWHDICFGAVPEGKGSLREICPRECARKVLYPELEDDDALVVQHFVDLLRTTVEMFPEPKVDASAGEDESVAPETSVSSEDSRSIASLDEDEFGRRRLSHIRYWVDDGCHSERHPDPNPNDLKGSFNEPSSLAGVRCCNAAGNWCGTVGSCPGYHTYSDAAALCVSTFGSSYRLCTKDELHTEICCGSGGMCDHHPVWTSTQEVPEPYRVVSAASVGRASSCPWLTCKSFTGGPWGLNQCKQLCDSYDQCNVFNFCPMGASCVNFYSNPSVGLGRCCVRDCHSTDRSHLQLTRRWNGWDVYIKE